ncbi:MAG: hypothetical protein ACR2OZ_12495 [Verrucomicrobiales bacterium]
MFETTFSDLLSHYVWALLALVGLIWLVGEWRRLRCWRRERRGEVACRLCGGTFRDLTDERLVVCPSCQALNERRRPREI